MTLNTFLETMDADVIRVKVPLTNFLTAQVVVDTTDTAELDDLVRMYGNHRVKRFTPVTQNNAVKLEIQLAEDVHIWPQADGGK